MSQFCTNSLHSQEKWTVALVEEHYSLCNYNLCSGRQKELHHITKYNRALKQKKKDFLSNKEREIFLYSISILFNIIFFAITILYKHQNRKKRLCLLSKERGAERILLSICHLDPLLHQSRMFFSKPKQNTQNFLLFFFSG